MKSTDDSNVAQFEKLKSVGDQVVGNSERRFQMLELMAAIDSALPREKGLRPGQVSQRPLMAKSPDRQRVELYIETMESKFYGSEDSPLAGEEGWWGDAAKASYANTLIMLKQLEAETRGKQPTREVAAEEDGADPSEAPEETEEEAADAEAVAAEIADLEGAGWVIELSGHHFHNLRYPMAGSEYVRRTLVKNLMTGSVKLPVGGGKYDTFTMEELGVSHALIAEDGKITLMDVPNPDWAPPKPEGWDMDPAAMGQMPGFGDVGKQEEAEEKKPEQPQFLKPRTHKFKVHFLWRPTRLSERLEKRRLAAENQNQPAEGEI